MINNKAHCIDGRALLSLLLVIVLPNFVYVVFETSSLAAGLLLTSVLMVAINYKQLSSLHRKTFVVVLILSLLLVSHACYMFYVSGEVKALSTIGLVPIFLTVPILSVKLVKLPYFDLELVFRFLVCSLSVIGWVGLIYVFLFVGGGQKMKYPFPFSEPSFFALCYGLFSVGYCCVASSRFSICILINLVLFSILFPSLTFLVFSVIICLVMFFRLRSFYFLIGLFVLPVVFFSVGYFVISDIEYFSDRLKLSDTENITTLVWLQGWDLSYLNFFSTDGRGLGMQMLGEDGSQLGEISYKLEQLTGKLMNVSSGGFLASKLISELGLLGLAISCLYVMFLLWFSLTLAIGRDHSSQNGEAKRKLILQGVVFGYVVEFFFRGYGYFSPDLYVVVAAVMALYHINTKEILVGRSSLGVSCSKNL